MTRGKLRVRVKYSPMEPASVSPRSRVLVWKRTELVTLKTSQEKEQGCQNSFVLRENQIRHTIELALRALCYFGKRGNQ
jgi:hypothetical protein